MKTIKTIIAAVLVLITLTSCSNEELIIQEETTSNIVYIEVNGIQVGLDTNMIGKWATPYNDNDMRTLYIFKSDGQYTKFTEQRGVNSQLIHSGFWQIDDVTGEQRLLLNSRDGLGYAVAYRFTLPTNEFVRIDTVAYNLVSRIGY